MKDWIVDWNECFIIPLELPLIHDTLKFTVWDKDSLIDELCASFIINAKSALKYAPEEGGQTCKKWINLYGAPMGYSGDNCKAMNNDPTVATAWKGRVFVEYWVESIKYPIMSIKEIKDFTALNAMEKAVKEYELAIEFGEGICLPYKKDFKLRLIIGSHKFESDSAKQYNQSWNRWSKRTVVKFKETYNNLKRFPTFFLQLTDGDKWPLCYYRDSLVNFTDPSAPMRWVALEKDDAVGYVKDDEKAGFVSFRLFIRETSDKNTAGFE